MSSQRCLFQCFVAALMLIGPLTALIPAEPPAGRNDRGKTGRTDKAGASQKSDSARKQSTSKTARRSSENGSVKRIEPFSREREENAIRFARKHHAELAELLEGLKRSDSESFQAGVRELARDAERLGKLAERDRERFDVSLKSWKLDSRIRLEIARLSMSLDEDFEARLRPMMEERQAARIQSLRLEEQRLSERLAKTKEQLKNLESNPTELVSSEIARLRKLIAARARAKGPRPQTAADTAAANQRTSRDAKTTKTRKLPTTSAD